MNTPDKNKENQDKDFPGYPHYPAGEDIAANNNGIVSIDADPKDDDNARPEDDNIIMGTEADITDADRELLAVVDDGRSINNVKDLLDNTDDDGEPLNEDNSASGLDVPGSEVDDANERIGAEDEENNYYSLGSDSNDSLEESEDR